MNVVPKCCNHCQAYKFCVKQDLCCTECGYFFFAGACSYSVTEEDRRRIEEEALKKKL
ncbi:hypothetical protein ACFLRC_04380 [Candidatus Altiarchaeota archaeon]